MRLRIESVRGRLTFFYVVVLGVVLLVAGGLTYFLLARVLYNRIDGGLLATIQIASASLRTDLREGRDVAAAARRTADALASPQQMLAIYDSGGRLLAERGRDDGLDIQLPPPDDIPDTDALLFTVDEMRAADDRHRLAMQRVILDRDDAPYILVAATSLEPVDEELDTLLDTLALIVPIVLLLAGVAGWFLAHRSLAPVVAMAERARQIGGEDLSRRLPLVNPRDELGQLAATFNELLARLESAMRQQRQFMADASHELRTPITTTRTAASVALQLEHRDEDEYRKTLQLVERQAARLARIVDDMFVLARADAGNYPVRMQPMYLDEVVDEVVAAARVVGSTRNVRIEAELARSVSFVGDEELIRRLVVNLVDNAVRHSPDDGVVHVELHAPAGAEAYRIVVTDHGAGIPPDQQPHIFERFYRADGSWVRGRAESGAGLGLALARWVARVHGGDVALTESSGSGSTFTASLPVRG